MDRLFGPRVSSGVQLSLKYAWNQLIVPLFFTAIFRNWLVIKKIGRVDDAISRAHLNCRFQHMKNFRESKNPRAFLSIESWIEIRPRTESSSGPESRASKKRKQWKKKRKRAKINKIDEQLPVTVLFLSLSIFPSLHTRVERRKTCFVEKQMRKAKVGSSICLIIYRHWPLLLLYTRSAPRTSLWPHDNLSPSFSPPEILMPISGHHLYQNTLSLLAVSNARVILFYGTQSI